MLKEAENAKDPIIPNIIYNNFKPLVNSRGEELLKLLGDHASEIEPFNATVVAWLKECIAGGGLVDKAELVKALSKELSKSEKDAKRATRALTECIDAFKAANIKLAERAKAFDENTHAAVSKLASSKGEAQVPATVVALWWRDPQAAESARKIVADPKADLPSRSALIKALAEGKDEADLDIFEAVFNDASAPLALRKDAADALGVFGGEKASLMLLKNFKSLPPELKSACVNNLAGHLASAKILLDALEAKALAPADINSNNARAIVQLNDAALAKRVTALWGKVKTDAERDPARVEVVNKMRKVVQSHKPGDALKGWKVFEKNCQQCHKIYGKGNDVGPDLTGVGRDNLDLILNSVIDPNLVIGEGYYQHMVKTKEGQVITGLIAEETEKSLSLKLPGGEVKKLSKDDIALHKATRISLMPEELEKVMNEDEFCDLVAFMLTKEAPSK
jgi:putative heme-binding domain-containing protein